MMLNKKLFLVKITTIIFIFLTGCNLSAKTNPPSEKVFELDLTNQGISSEGGGIELEKSGKNCLLILSIYGETGQEKYKFKFNKNNLISTNYVNYRYRNGLINIDDDLKDLIADDHSELSDSDMELVVDKIFIGSENINITQKFNTYKRKIPSNILINNCN
ncbi:hypothetical protein ACSFV5_02090 [Acinetobacter sp. HC8-3S]